ncbi:TPA: hypothetical protein ACNUX9_003487 [Providencia rettgeri]
MSESQSAGGIHYDVSMDIKELLVGEKQVNKVMDNVEKSTDKATNSLNKLDKVASQVGVAMKMPEINKLSRDMAQLSGKIGANSAATEKAAQTHNRFTGVLSTVSSSLGAGYVGNIGNATESLIKHTQAAINATAEEIKNAEVMQKQAQAYQAEASQLVLSTQEKRKAAEEAVTLAESELQVAEALADRKTVSLESLEALKKSQQYQLRQAELNDEMSSNERTLAEVTKARTAVQRTQNQIDKQSNEIANDVWKAEDKVKAAKENLHNTTIELNKAKGLEAQATATVIAADEASALAKEKATMAAKAQVIAMNGLRSVMALLGGPTGVILLVAAGVYALYQAMSNTDKIDEFNKKIDDSIDKLDELNNAQAKYAADKFGKDIRKVSEELKEYEKEINHTSQALKTADLFGSTDVLNEKLNKNKALADDAAQRILMFAEAADRASEQARKTEGMTMSQVKAQNLLNKETKDLVRQNEMLSRSMLDGDDVARSTIAINDFKEKLEKLGIYGKDAADYDQEQKLLSDSYAAQKMTHEQYTAAKSATDMQYHMLITAMDKQYQEQQTAAQWELMRNQSTGYEALASAIDSLGGNASNVITGLATKTMDAADAARSLGSTMLNSVLNSYVQLGVEMLKNFVLSKTLGAASQAANAAAAAAGGTAALAAWTPAAIAASIATGGTASATGLGAFKTSMLSGQAMSMMGLAGARYNGGPVNAGEMYRVGEHGKPEIYRASSGKQYMIPGDNGRVISNKDMQGSGGGQITFNIINQGTPQQVTGYSESQGPDGSRIIEVMTADIQNGGTFSQMLSAYHNAPRKALGGY